MIWKFLIRNPLKELYWTGETGDIKAQFSMFPKKAKRFNTYEEAEKELTLGTMPAGYYMIDKIYKV